MSDIVKIDFFYLKSFSLQSVISTTSKEGSQCITYFQKLDGILVEIRSDYSVIWRTDP